MDGESPGNSLESRFRPTFCHSRSRGSFCHGIRRNYTFLIAYRYEFRNTLQSCVPIHPVSQRLRFLEVGEKMLITQFDTFNNWFIKHLTPRLPHDRSIHKRRAQTAS